MQAFQMIAADLDGTLLNHQSRLSDFSAAVLESFAEKGAIIVFATGRAYFTIPEQVRCFSAADYIISSNGAAVYDTKSTVPIRNTVLESQSVQALVDCALRNELGLELITGGKVYAEKRYFEHPEAFAFDSRSLHYLFSTRTKIASLDAFLEAHGGQIESIDFVLPDPTRRTAIQSQFSDDASLYVTSSHPRIVEFSAAGGGKAPALRFLLEREGIPAAKLIAFGNAENDLAMLDLAAVGVATANAPEEVKAQADAVCKSCDEDGVAKYLKMLI